MLRRKTGQTEAGWVEGSINSFTAGAPTLKSAAEDPRNIVNSVIVCCVSIQEKVRRSPKGFVRNGNEREREGGGGGGCRSAVTRDELENDLAERSTLNQRHKSADLPSSWRLTSTRTHLLPRTLVFRGFTSHQLGSRSLTLGPLVDTAFMTSHGHLELKSMRLVLNLAP